MKRPLRDFSQLDQGQILKDVHEELGSSLRVSNANSEVPTGYSKVVLTTNDVGSVTKAIFYAGKSAQKTRIKFKADVSGSLNNKYFYINSAEDKILYYIWYNVNGSGVDPNVLGRVGIEIPISLNDTAYFVTKATYLMLSQIEYFNIEQNGQDVLLIENSQYGATTDSADINTGFFVTTPVEGTTVRIKTIELPDENGIKYIFNYAERKFETIADIQGKVIIEGLNVGQNVALDINSTTWTPLSAVVPVDSDTISVNIQNADKTSDVKVSFNNTDENGMLIYKNGGERQYVVKKTLEFYFKSLGGTLTLNIEVLA